MNHADSQKPKTVLDLARGRQAVDIYIRTGEGQQVIKNVTLAHVQRNWVTIVHYYRGVEHQLHLPRESIVKIDRRSRVRRRR